MELTTADRIGNALMDSEEREDAIPIPTSVFSEHEMRQAISGSMIHTLRLFGLELRQLTPDLKAIYHFLRLRYNYGLMTSSMKTFLQMRVGLPLLNVFVMWASINS